MNVSEPAAGSADYRRPFCTEGGCDHVWEDQCSPTADGCGHVHNRCICGELGELDLACAQHKAVNPDDPRPFTLDEWNDILDRVFDHMWEDPTRAQDCLRFALSSLGILADPERGRGDKPLWWRREAVYALRRMARRTADGELNAATERRSHL